MDRHLESSVLLILTAVIFIKPICSIKVCTCCRYIVPLPLLVCIRKKKPSRRLLRIHYKTLWNMFWSLQDSLSVVQNKELMIGKTADATVPANRRVQLSARLQ